MIDYISGVLHKIDERYVTVVVHGFGLKIAVPHTKNLVIGSSATFHTHLHWSQENGPALFGFSNELERTVFLMIIECPKIGPSIGLNILGQLSVAEFLSIVASQNEKALSKVNGIGTKKAEQIIVELKHKVSKILEKGALHDEPQQDFVQWQNVSDVLSSLNYSKTEITKVMQHLTAKYTGQNCSLDQLIRAALGFLSSNQLSS